MRFTYSSADQNGKMAVGRVDSQNNWDYGFPIVYCDTFEQAKAFVEALNIAYDTGSHDRWQDFLYDP